MNNDAFVDSNVAIYALDPLSSKGVVASGLLRQHPVMSTQVVLETVNVLLKKLGFTKEDAYEHARFLLFNSNIVTLSESTLRHGFDVSLRYKYSHWDSMIIASAIESHCETLYSEDLRDGQVIEGVTIRNPFLSVRE